MTKYIWICKQSWVYEGKTWWKREEVEHVPCTPVLWLFYLNGRAGIYMYLQQKKPHQALQMECLPFVFEKTWQKKSYKSYCNIFAMNHWCFKSDCGQNLWKIIFVLHIFSTKNMVNKQTSKSHCNSLDMTHWMFLKRLWTEFMDRNLCFATFFRPTHGEKTLLNLIAIVWTWPTECFWSDCRING